MGSFPPAEKLRRWELAGLCLFAVIVPLFGALVVYRSAFQEHRHTDFTVYARAGWAVRTGQDIYQVTDDAGLHYCYPPPFAVLMTPLADPPNSDDSPWYLPFAVSVAIWF